MDCPLPSKHRPRQGCEGPIRYAARICHAIVCCTLYIPLHMYLEAGTSDNSIEWYHDNGALYSTPQCLIRSLSFLPLLAILPFLTPSFPFPSLFLNTPRERRTFHILSAHLQNSTLLLISAALLHADNQRHSLRYSSLLFSMKLSTSSLLFVVTLLYADSRVLRIFSMFPFHTLQIGFTLY